MTRLADADADDHGWDTIDLTALQGSPTAIGFPDSSLDGWRRTFRLLRLRLVPAHMTVPAGHASWEILGPTLVEDGYEIYWNGWLLGGSAGSAEAARRRHSALGCASRDAAGTHGMLAYVPTCFRGPAAARQRWHAHRAHAGSTPDQRCASSCAMATIHRRIHRRCDRPLAMLAVVGLAIGRWFDVQPQRFPGACRNRTFADGSQTREQCNYAWTDLLDFHLCVADEIHQDAGDGRLDGGLDRWAASVANSRPVGCGVCHRCSPWHHGSFGEPDWLQPDRVDCTVCLDRRAHCPSGPMRTLTLAALASIMASLFGENCLIPSACRASGSRSASAFRDRRSFTPFQFRSLRS